MEIRITWEEFCSDIMQLRLASDALRDGWVLKGDISESGRAFLSKTLRCRRKILTETDFSCPQLFEDSKLKEDENISGASDDLTQILTFEYHILYSVNYQVPVLYLNAWRQNGTLLSIEDLWNLAPESHKPAVKGSKWNAISQEDHPLLGTPYFFFHPCKSASLLGDLHESKKNKVVFWLSVVGPILGLEVSVKYINVLKALEDQN